MYVSNWFGVLNFTEKDQIYWFSAFRRGIGGFRGETVNWTHDYFQAPISEMMEEIPAAALILAAVTMAVILAEELTLPVVILVEERTLVVILEVAAILAAEDSTSNFPLFAFLVHKLQSVCSFEYLNYFERYF